MLNASGAIPVHLCRAEITLRALSIWEKRAQTTLVGKATQKPLRISLFQEEKRERLTTGPHYTDNVKLD